MYAIEVQNTSKVYKNGVKALDSINLKVKKGEIFTLLGKNGAGKSTLISILTTYLKPSSGTLTILEKEILNESQSIRSQIACVAQQTSIDTHLSLEENMMFQARLYNIPYNEAKQRMATLIEEFKLSEYLKYPVSSYSGGIKRRLDIALNMMSNPQILFLDEPTVGMDIQSRKTMWELITNIRDQFETTIFLTTHYLEEADILSDTICIMKDGKEIIQGSPFELRNLTHQDTITIKCFNKKDAQELIRVLRNHFIKHEFTLNNEIILVPTISSRKDLIILNKFLIQSDIIFKGIEVVEPSLEDIFLRLTEIQEVL